MSDSEDSTVTFGGLSDIVYSGVNGPPVMPEDPYAYVVAAFQAPPSLDYVPGPEYPPSPEFVPELVYPKFIPPEDDRLPAEEQPLPAAISPGYVLESDPEEDPKEGDDEDPEEDPVDYPSDRGDDGDESSDDDEDDDDHAPFAEETEPFETDESAATPSPHLAYRVARLLAIPTLPPSPLSLWLSPLPQIPSPPLPPILSPLLVSSPPPASPTYPLGYKAAMIRLRAEAPSTSHLPPPHIILSHTRADTPPSGTPPSGTPPLLPIPLPTSSPPLHLLSTDHRADRPEVTLLPRKRLGITLGPRYEVRESSSAPTARPPGGFMADYGFVATMDMKIRRDLKRDVDYGITDTCDDMLVDMPGAPATDDTELDDEQTERHLMAGRLNMLYRDRRAHARITLLMERERLGCLERLEDDPWTLAADRRRQEAITELLAADHRRQHSSLRH
ncbi:hypothetical protein Tco_1086089 [Tanacetum coccineum]